jgi:hypothetical protein
MYEIDKQGDSLCIMKDGAPVHTPMGNPVQTRLPAIAKRLVKDLKRYGDDASDPRSIVAFQYPMIDFFLTESRKDLEGSVVAGLNQHADWTLSCPSAAPEMTMAWMSLFGHPTEQSDAAKTWLSDLSLRQLCAVTVLGRNLESVNIPFIVATLLKPEGLGAYAAEVAKRYPCVSRAGVKTMFDNYLFYFHADSGLKA